MNTNCFVDQDARDRTTINTTSLVLGDASQSSLHRTPASGAANHVPVCSRKKRSSSPEEGRECARKAGVQSSESQTTSFFMVVCGGGGGGGRVVRS